MKEPNFKLCDVSSQWQNLSNVINNLLVILTPDVDILQNMSFTVAICHIFLAQVPKKASLVFPILEQ